MVTKTTTTTTKHSLRPVATRKPKQRKRRRGWWWLWCGLIAIAIPLIFTAVIFFRAEGVKFGVIMDTTEAPQFVAAASSLSSTLSTWLSSASAIIVPFMLNLLERLWRDGFLRLIGGEENWMACKDAMSTAAQRAHDEVWIPMDVPDYEVYQVAAQDALRSLLQAAMDTGTLLYLILRPLSVGAWILLKAVGLWVYRQILIEWVSIKGSREAIRAAKVVYEFQSQLTTAQWCLEGAIMVGMYLLYQLRKWLQKQQFVRRGMTFAQKRLRQLNKTRRRALDRIGKAYRHWVERVALFSLWSAVMLPHGVYWAGTGLFWIFAPRFWRFWAVETSLVDVLNWWIPIFYTMSLIHEISILQPKEDKADATDDQKENSSPKKTSVRSSTNFYSGRGGDAQENATKRAVSRRNVFPRTRPKSMSNVYQSKKNSSEEASVSSKGSTNSKRRRFSLFGSSGEENDEKPAPTRAERVEYWLDYWMVHSAVQLVKMLLYQMPIVGSLFARLSWLDSGFQILELAFYIWLYVMPHILLDEASIRGMVSSSKPPKIPEARPLAFLAPRIGQSAEATAAGNNLFSVEWWETWPVAWTSTFTNIAVLMGTLSRPTATVILRIVREGRPLCIPLMTLFVPVVSAYGLAFVQYGVPLTKTYQTRKDHPIAKGGLSFASIVPEEKTVILQYWVLHAFMLATIHHMMRFLWWFPATSFATFALFWYLQCMTDTALSFYRHLQDDLYAFGLFPVHTVANTKQDFDNYEGTNDDKSQYTSGCDDAASAATEPFSSGGVRRSIYDTHTLKFLTWAIEQLPSAKDDHHNHHHNHDQIEASESQVNESTDIGTSQPDPAWDAMKTAPTADSTPPKSFDDNSNFDFVHEEDNRYVDDILPPTTVATTPMRGAGEDFDDLGALSGTMDDEDVYGFDANYEHVPSDEGEEPYEDMAYRTASSDGSDAAVMQQLDDDEEDGEEVIYSQLEGEQPPVEQYPLNESRPTVQPSLDAFAELRRRQQSIRASASPPVSSSWMVSSASNTFHVDNRPKEEVAVVTTTTTASLTTTTDGAPASETPLRRSARRRKAPASYAE